MHGKSLNFYVRTGSAVMVAGPSNQHHDNQVVYEDLGHLSTLGLYVKTRCAAIIGTNTTLVKRTTKIQASTNREGREPEDLTGSRN